MTISTHMVRLLRTVIFSWVCLAAAYAGTADADTIFLDSLLGGGAVTSGDLTFYDFEYSPNSNAPGAEFISVQAVSQGIKFAVPLLQVGTGVVDFDITYKVAGLGGPGLAGLSSVGHGDDGGFTTIIQNINAGTDLLATINNNFIDGGGWNFDSAEFSGVSPLKITTDVGLWAGGGTASLSDWTQTFGVSSIPAPAAGLGGMVLLGLVMARRRWA